jgi:hypothetical protein
METRLETVGCCPWCGKLCKISTCALVLGYVQRIKNVSMDPDEGNLNQVLECKFMNFDSISSCWSGSIVLAIPRTWFSHLSCLINIITMATRRFCCSSSCFVIVSVLLWKQLYFLLIVFCNTKDPSYLTLTWIGRGHDGYWICKLRKMTTTGNIKLVLTHYIELIRWN